MSVGWNDFGSLRLLPRALRRVSKDGYEFVTKDKLTTFAFLYLSFAASIAIFGSQIAPYPHDQYIMTDDGQLVRSATPSLAHPLGTTETGRDILSRVLVGARPTMFAGLIGGLTIMSVGTTVGLISGYLGGWVDESLMRFTDLVYSLPIVPLALVMVALFGFKFLGLTLLIGFVLWRGSARVIRSQVLSIRERPYILAAKAYGASELRILLKHVLPSVAPMAGLFFALGIGWTIIIQAGLAFIGVSDPFTPSWGVMVRNAHFSSQLGRLWWWAVVPGMLISFTVLSAFILGRALEEDEAQQSVVIT